MAKGWKGIWDVVVILVVVAHGLVLCGPVTP